MAEPHCIVAKLTYFSPVSSSALWANGRNPVTCERNTIGTGSCQIGTTVFRVKGNMANLPSHVTHSLESAYYGLTVYQTEV